MAKRICRMQENIPQDTSVCPQCKNSWPILNMTLRLSLSMIKEPVLLTGSTDTELQFLLWKRGLKAEILSMWRK